MGGGKKGKEARRTMASGWKSLQALGHAKLFYSLRDSLTPPLYISIFMYISLPACVLRSVWYTRSVHRFIILIIYNIYYVFVAELLVIIFSSFLKTVI